MWKTINQSTNKRSKTTNMNELLINDESVKKPELIADTMNSYFCDVRPFLANNLSNSDNCFEAYINATNTTFEIQKISDLNVKSEILKIKTSKVTGPDRISPKLLKDSVGVITESLTNIFNKSIEFGIFPDDFKTACISPIQR